MLDASLAIINIVSGTEFRMLRANDFDDTVSNKRFSKSERCPRLGIHSSSEIRIDREYNELAQNAAL
jgi:hypothetical protein